MQYFILILKGFLVGIGKIIPGVSGSLIAISLGIYDELINSVAYFFKNIEKNIRFLFCVGIGIILALYVFSNVIRYFLNLNYLFTMAIFLGLFLGVLPNFLKEINYKKNDIFSLLFLLIILLISGNINLSIRCLNSFPPIYYIILGFIDALTMIVPGISGTAIFMMLDSYDAVLGVFTDFVFNNVFFFGVGLLIGIYLTIKLVSFLLNKYYQIFYKFISYVSIYSISILFIKLFSYINMSNIFIFLVLLFSSCFISKKMNNL